MDEDRKSDSGSLNRRHFATIHEKIQIKYLQMQKRLDKSRSMDSLTTLNDGFVFQQQTRSENIFSYNKKAVVKVSSENNSDDQPTSCKIVVEDVSKSEAVLREANSYESINNDSVFIENENNLEDNLLTKQFFGADFKNSSESLNNALKDSDENPITQTPPTKISIREKINSRILAAKEKRREKERDKKRESNRKDEKDIDFLDSEVYDTEYVLVDNDCNLSTQHALEDDFKTSIESVCRNFKLEYSHNNLLVLQEVSKEIDVDEISLTPSSPSTKVSIRDKINSKLLAAKEKRREKEKDKEKKRESKEKIDKIILSNSKKNKIATVTVALIEATALGNEFQSTVDEKPRLFYCRLRLGSEKRKSRAVSNNSAVVSWQELFNLNMFEDKLLEVSFWERLNFLGRTIIDLSEVQKEKTHKMKLNLEEGNWNTQLFVLLTISGTGLVNIFGDLDEYWDKQNKLKSEWYKFRDDFTDVGWLTITAYGAKGLSTNECYCVFGLGNERRQTQTESKTNDPNWMKIFEFTITDVTSILEVTVYDDKKSEEVGRVSIPLLNIHNKAKWYALKDSTQRGKAKGNNPRILLEMKFTWNLLKASVRVINPKESNYLDCERGFDRRLFARNLSRAKVVVSWVLDAFQVIKTCFEWESRKWNAIALTAWLLFCWFFKIWMIPLLIIIPFAWYRPPEYFLVDWKQYVKNETTLEESDDKEEKNTTWRQKLNSFQDMVQAVQNFIGKVATLGESIKNLFNFTVPFLSCLAIFFILAIAFVMYLIPLHYILMGWGIHKFTRKALRPNRIPNNEVLDLLSRVPDDETLLNCEEIPLEELCEDDNNI